MEMWNGTNERTNEIGIRVHKCEIFRQSDSITTLNGQLVGTLSEFEFLSCKSLLKKKMMLEIPNTHRWIN